MTLILQQPWTRQPVSARVDWSSPFSRDALAIFDGARVQTRNGDIPPAYLSASFGSGIYGKCLQVSAVSDSVARFDIGQTLSASDPCSIEFLIVASSFTNLGTVATLSNGAYTTGKVNASGVENGAMRGVLSYTGSPLNIYYWNSNQDLNSSVAFQTDVLQHIILTKEAGTGAVTLNVYRNGSRIASGASSNISPWATSGPYWYLGGRHESATAASALSIFSAGIYRREMSPAEVAERYARPWRLFKPRQIIIPASVAASTYTLSNATYAPGSITASGVTPRVTVTVA